MPADTHVKVIARFNVSVLAGCGTALLQTHTLLTEAVPPSMLYDIGYTCCHHYKIWMLRSRCLLQQLMVPVEAAALY